jgi:DNA-binding transcriptional ArsR family regulator
MATNPEHSRKSKQARRASLRPHLARDQILDAMRSYGKPITPGQIARISGATLGSTAYHVRVLHQAGLIELEDEGRVRGAVEHFYVIAPEEETLTDPVTQLLNLCDALTVPDPAGGYPRPTILDDTSRAELHGMIEAITPRVQEVALKSTERLTKP